MSLEQPSITNIAKAYIKLREARIGKFATMLMEQEGTDVISLKDARKVLKRFHPRAATMSPHELQWVLNCLLSKIIPSNGYKYVHVDGGPLAPLKKSTRLSYQVGDDLEEIFMTFRVFLGERQILLGF